MKAHSVVPFAGRILLGTAFAAGLLLVAGCQTGVPPEALKSTPVSLQLRRLQTRRFDGTSERQILQASAGLLQDLGYNIDGSETKLGLITASKQRSAFDSAVWQSLNVYNLGQTIRISLVTRPASDTDPKAFFVRITINRIFWEATPTTITGYRTVEQPEIYEEFFDKLSQSLFLEAHQI